MASTARQAHPKHAEPRTGSYYWCPVPATSRLRRTNRPQATADLRAAGAWTLAVFYDGDQADTAHVRVWPAVVRLVATRWGLPPETLARRLRMAYTALPRGRVTRALTGAGEAYNILHGGDGPVPDAIEQIAAAFKLGNATCKVIMDDHETRLAEDVADFQRATHIAV